MTVSTSLQSIARMLSAPDHITDIEEFGSFHPNDYEKDSIAYSFFSWIYSIKHGEHSGKEEKKQDLGTIRKNIRTTLYQQPSIESFSDTDIAIPNCPLNGKIHTLHFSYDKENKVMHMYLDDDKKTYIPLSMHYESIRRKVDPQFTSRTIEATRHLPLSMAPITTRTPAEPVAKSLPTLTSSHAGKTEEKDQDTWEDIQLSPRFAKGSLDDEALFKLPDEQKDNPALETYDESEEDEDFSYKGIQKRHFLTPHNPPSGTSTPSGVPKELSRVAFKQTLVTKLTEVSDDKRVRHIFVSSSPARLENQRSTSVKHIHKKDKH